MAPARLHMESSNTHRSSAPAVGNAGHAVGWLRRLWAQLHSSEVSGSLGDLGTYLPLTVAMSASIGLDLGTTLIFSGAFNIISGLVFDCPICVQPMHTICGVALAAAKSANPVTLPQVMAAGIFVSGCVLVIGGLQLAELFGWLVPPPVIRGVQLGVGLNVAIKGVDMALRVKSNGVAAWRPWWGTDGLVLGAACLAFLLVTTMAPKLASERDWQPLPRDTVLEPLIRPVLRAAPGGGSTAVEERGEEESPLIEAQAGSGVLGQGQGDCCVVVASGSGSSEAPDGKEGQLAGAGPASAAAGAAECCGGATSPIPSALLVVVLGILLAAVKDPSGLSQLRLGPSVPLVSVPSAEDFQQGIIRMGLPQLPLTTLNSVVAVAELARQLFPERDSRRFRPSRFALSVGVMNLVGCWFGALPTCHGAGGMAAQFKFGAREAAAPVILGLMKVSLGLLLGSSLLQLLSSFPNPMLGALLALAGVELACSARAQVGARGYTLMLLTAACILSIDTGMGFVLGWSAAVLVAVSSMLEGACRRLWQQLRSGTSRRYERLPTP